MGAKIWKIIVMGYKTVLNCINCNVYLPTEQRSNYNVHDVINRNLF